MHDYPPNFKGAVSRRRTSGICRVSKLVSPFRRFCPQPAYAFRIDILPLYGPSTQYANLTSGEGVNELFTVVHRALAGKETITHREGHTLCNYPLRLFVTLF